MMNVLFFDVRRKNNDAFFQKTVNNMTFQELLYADDTLVIAKNTQTAKDYLRYIEEESEYYNIKLNRDKCVCITYNRNNQITFADGQKLKSVDETIYLGTQISKRDWNQSTHLEHNADTEKTWLVLETSAGANQMEYSSI